MHAHGCLILVVALAGLMAPTVAHAQVDLDRVVGKTVFAEPLVIKELNGSTLGRLAFAAGTPMGFEGLPTAQVFPAIEATGRKLGDVLAALAASDSRYAWRQDAGVIVFRPRTSWAAPNGLETSVGPVDLKQIDQGDALRAVARVFGTEATGANGDSLRFSVEMPQGGTILDLLNHIVRAHGRLAWAVEYAEPRNADKFPHRVSLLNGNGGSGVGIRRGLTFDPPVPVPARSRALLSDVSPIPVLDRIIGPRRDGSPLKVIGIFASVSELADAAQTPMGLERLPQAKVAPQLLRPGFEGVAVTGMRLGDALSVLEQLSPQYEWRLLDEVVVFRPRTAWADADDPLYRPMPARQMPEASLNDAMGEIHALFGTRKLAYGFADLKRFRVEPQPTLLDFLNAVAKGHGELSWTWEEVGPPDERAARIRYVCSFSTFGGGGKGLGIE